MAAWMLARAIFMTRQRDGLATGFVGSKGGRVRDLPGNPFSEENRDQPCVDPRSCEFRFLGWQRGKAGEALHPFKGEFDLPAKTIEGEHVGRRERVGWQRSEEENVVRRLE